MVGGDHQERLPVHRSEHRREVRVEGLQSLGIALRVVAMTELRVEIVEVGEDQSVRSLADERGHLLGPVRVVGGVDGAPDALSGKDVADLPDADGLHACLPQVIERGRARRGQRIVAALVGALQCARLTHERPGDHPRDLPLIAEHLPRDLTGAVEFVQRDDAGMRGDLKDAVAGGVDDPRAGLRVLSNKLLDNLRAGGRAVPDDRPPRPALELADDLRREAVGEGREGPRAYLPHHLPVADHRVLARGLLGHASERARGLIGGSHAFDLREVAETVALEGRQAQATDGA